MAGKYLSVHIHFVWSTTGRVPWISRSSRNSGSADVLPYPEVTIFCNGNCEPNLISEV